MAKNDIGTCYVCTESKCSEFITAYGSPSSHEAALRRVDWGTSPIKCRKHNPQYQELVRQGRR